MKNQITNVKQARAQLDAYLRSIKPEFMNVGNLETIFGNYSALAEKLDNNILDLEQELEEVTTEQSRLQSDTSADEKFARLPWQVSIKVWAQKDEEVDILLTYGS